MSLKFLNVTNCCALGLSSIIISFVKSPYDKVKVKGSTQIDYGMCDTQVGHTCSYGDDMHMS